MAGELSASRLQQGRLSAAAGELLGAEDLLWHEYHENPDSPSARSALWEFYSLPSYLRTSANDEKECRAAADAVQATGNRDGTIRLFDPSGRRKTIQISPVGDVRSLRLSADGTLLLAAGAGGVALVNAKDGSLRRQWWGGELC
jgi:hypothetical protein